MSGVRLNPVSIKSAGNVVDSKKAEVKFDINKLQKAIGHCRRTLEKKQRNTTIGNCLESSKLMKTVRLEKHSRRILINSGYKVARILEKNFALALLQLKVRDLEVPNSGL